MVYDGFQHDYDALAYITGEQLAKALPTPICHIIGLLDCQIQTLAACTGAVMCVQGGE